MRKHRCRTGEVRGRRQTYAIRPVGTESGQLEIGGRKCVRLVNVKTSCRQHWRAFLHICRTHSIVPSPVQSYGADGLPLDAPEPTADGWTIPDGAYQTVFECVFLRRGLAGAAAFKALVESDCVAPSPDMPRGWVWAMDVRAPRGIGVGNGPEKLRPRPRERSAPTKSQPFAPVPRDAAPQFLLSVGGADGPLRPVRWFASIADAKIGWKALRKRGERRALLFNDMMVKLAEWS